MDLYLIIFNIFTFFASFDVWMNIRKVYKFKFANWYVKRDFALIETLFIIFFAMSYDGQSKITLLNISTTLLYNTILGGLILYYGIFKKNK